MTLPLIISEEAEQDLKEAKSWYERKRKGLGREFVHCVEAALDFIRRFPDGGTKVYQEVRRVSVRRFPYSVFFLVQTDHIAVLAVYHSKRDPINWQQRI